MSFSLTILGSSSALPKPDRFTTAHVLNVHERFFLIDCGEGTQIQLRRFKFRFGKINHAFISHLHGDHFLGLFGLLSSMSLMGRKNPFFLFGPPELNTILDQYYLHLGERLRFTIDFFPIPSDQPALIFENTYVSVTSIPLSHKIPTTGFIFREKLQANRIDKSTISAHELSIAEIVKLKAGKNVERANGEQLQANKLTIPPPRARSFAYLSDTRYDPSLVEYLQNIDLLYHEATYLHAMRDRAHMTGHATAKEAAQLAVKANVDQLLIGHFSSRYKKVEPFLEEACQLFPKTQLATDGLTVCVDNS